MLEIQNLKKKYGDDGIEDIDVTLEEGIIYAVIGPNGVGKTTLLETVAGLLRPSEGQILLNDMSPLLRETKKYIGFALESDSCYPEMKLGDLLEFVYMQKYDDMGRDEIQEYLERYELSDSRNKYYHTMSTGMKKKTGIIMTFMGNPDLVLLDEPTNGVDTTGIIHIKEDMMTAKKRGAIVVVSSHELDFLTKVADVCFFMKNGRFVKKVSVSEEENLEDIYKEIYLS